MSGNRSFPICLMINNIYSLPEWMSRDKSQKNITTKIVSQQNMKSMHSGSEISCKTWRWTPRYFQPRSARTSTPGTPLGDSSATAPRRPSFAFGFASGWSSKKAACALWGPAGPSQLQESMAIFFRGTLFVVVSKKPQVWGSPFLRQNRITHAWTSWQVQRQKCRPLV